MATSGESPSEESASGEIGSSSDESKIVPSVPTGTGAIVEGVKEFAEKGQDLTKSTTPLKSTGKFKYYDGWNGNQYIKTGNVFNKGTMSTVAKRAPIVGNVLNGVEIAGGFEKDGYKIGKNTTKETAGAVGGTVGTIAGAKGGAITGAVVGSAFPVVGTTVGALVGGAVGAIGGALGGEMTFEWAVEKIWWGD